MRSLVRLNLLKLRQAWCNGHRGLLLGLAAALFPAVFAVRLAVDTPNDPLGHLYVLPIALAALALGGRGGLAAAGLALAMFVVQRRLQGLEIAALPLASRAITFALLGGVLGGFVDRLRYESTMRRRLAAVVDSSDDAIIALSANGTIVGWNDGASRLYGYSREEVIGHDEDLLTPEDRREEAAASRRRAFRGEVVRSLESARLTKAGEWLNVSLTVAPMRDLDGRITAASCIARDTTERARLTTDLERLHSSSALVLEAAGDGIYGVDLDGRATFVNPAAARMLGWAAEELVGKRLHDVIHHTHADGTPYPASDCPISGAFTSGSNRTVYGEVFWRRDGSSFPVAYTSTPITPSGEIVGAVVVFRDVTTEHRLEQERKLREAVTRALADASSVEESWEQMLATMGPRFGWDVAAFWELDRASSKLLCKSVWCGREAREFAKATRGTELEPGQGVPGRIWSTGGPLWLDDVRLEPNFTRAAAARVSGLGTAAGFPVCGGGGILGVIEFFATETRPCDPALLELMASAGTWVGQFTEAKQLERELTAKKEAESANQAKSELLSRISHELRTPLNAILGFGQLLQLERMSEGQDESVHQILSAGNHLLSLINEILDISRIEAGRADFALEPLDLDAALTSACELMQPLAAGRDIRLPCAHEGASGVIVVADQQRLNQVMLNLLSNAVKYNREGGSVVVAVDYAAGGRVRIRVTDTGIGIPQARMADVFSPFDRLGAERGPIDGTGLGLTLSKLLVEGMGGELTLDSEPGRGTTFMIELPRAEPFRKCATRGAVSAG